jgi:threonine dehydrogenase-like Zn-dependent dehydrogenase
MREFIPLPSHRAQAWLTAEGTVRVAQSPLPQLERGDILFRLLAAGISPITGGGAPSGTEELAAIPVGEVAAVGDGVSGYSPLDRALLLGPFERRSFSLPDGLTDFVHVPAALRAQGGVLKIPDGMPAEDAALIPATAFAHRLLREARVPAGGRLLVLGLGLVGQVLILVARHQKIERIVAADPSPTLRAKAEFNGAARTVRLFEEDLRQVVRNERAGMNAVVALAPHLDPLVESLDVLAPGGAVLVAARFPEAASMGFRLDPVRRGEIRFAGVAAPEDRDFRAALATVRHGTVNAESLVSRRVPWKELDGLSLPPETWTHGTQIAVHGPERPESP